jgi:hypothetical protein
MGSTQERIQKRRLYLMLKGGAYTLVGLMVLVAGLFFVIALREWKVGSLLGALVLLLAARQVTRFAHRVHRKAKQLPYVPPVTVNTLPAEEVLVRGSEEPKEEQGKVLLRGTGGSEGTGEQELLRSSQRQERD